MNQDLLDNIPCFSLGHLLFVRYEKGFSELLPISSLRNEDNTQAIGFEANTEQHGAVVGHEPALISRRILIGHGFVETSHGVFQIRINSDIDLVVTKSPKPKGSSREEFPFYIPHLAVKDKAHGVIALTFAYIKHFYQVQNLYTAHTNKQLIWNKTMMPISKAQ